MHVFGYRQSTRSVLKKKGIGNDNKMVCQCAHTLLHRDEKESIIIIYTWTRSFSKHHHACIYFLEEFSLQSSCKIYCPPSLGFIRKGPFRFIQEKEALKKCVYRIMHHDYWMNKLWVCTHSLNPDERIQSTEYS